MMTKPIARIDEKYTGEKWVLCTVHFGWHHERETCENPRDDSTEPATGGNTTMSTTTTKTATGDAGPFCQQHQVYHGAKASGTLTCWRERDAGLRDEHTPTPWEQTGNDEVTALRNAVSLEPIARFTGRYHREDAALALRSVNSHAALVAALKQFVAIYPANARRHPDVAFAIADAEHALRQAREGKV